MSLWTQAQYAVLSSCSESLNTQSWGLDLWGYLLQRQTLTFILFVSLIAPPTQPLQVFVSKLIKS